jgi:hypothetical protein
MATRIRKLRSTFLNRPCARGGIVREDSSRTCDECARNCRPKCNREGRRCHRLGSISQDPIGFAAGDTNQYRYVGNGPTNATDPSGLEEDKPFEPWSLVYWFFSGHKNKDQARNIRKASSFRSEMLLETVGTNKNSRDRAANAAYVAEGLIQSADIGANIVGAVCEPVDWIVTAQYVYDDPTNIWSYAGVFPLIPASGTKIAGKWRWARGAVSEAARQYDNFRQMPLVRQLTLDPSVQRWLLRRALDAPKDKIAHHVIPLEALKKYESLMQRAARGGFDINGVSNGVLLARADHRFGHPQYSRAILDELRQINRQARRLTDSQVARLIQDTADTARRACEDGTFRPWR